MPALVTGLGLHLETALASVQVMVPRARERWPMECCYFRHHHRRLAIKREQRQLRGESFFAFFLILGCSGLDGFMRSEAPPAFAGALLRQSDPAR